VTGRFGPAAFRWEGVEERPYKQAGGWEGVARFPIAARAGFEVRYFETAPGGYSSLENHEHAPGRRGRARPRPRARGREVVELAPFDLVETLPAEVRQRRGKVVGCSSSSMSCASASAVATARSRTSGATMSWSNSLSPRASDLPTASRTRPCESTHTGSASADSRPSTRCTAGISTGSRQRRRRGLAGSRAAARRSR
jgi:hypothetical protein